MKDIVGLGTDLRMYDAQSAKAANVLSVQIGALEYAKEFGIDLDFFIQEAFQFQNESFKAYLIQRLSEHNVNVNQVVETVEALFQKFTFTIGDTDKDTGGFIR